MIPKGLFTQMIMVVLAISIIMTYVQPAFGEIGSVQDTIEAYKVERNKTASVNSLLTTLLTRLDGVSNDDKRQLLTYLPDVVDEIAVPRDLVLITREAGVLYKGAKYESTEMEVVSIEDSENSTNIPKSHTFSLSVEGTYSQLKNLFRLLEQNNYPLEVRGLDIKQIDGGFLAAEIQLATYSYQEPVTNNKIVF